MTFRLVATVILVSVLSLPGIADAAASGRLDDRADFENRLRLLASLRSDPCDGTQSGGDEEYSFDREYRLFNDAASLVKEGLNAGSGGSDSGSVSEAPRDRAAAVLRDLQDQSAVINAAWPAESRFRVQILEVGSLLVVRMSVRNYDTFAAFASTGRDGASATWEEVGSDSLDIQRRSSSSSISLELYPLYAGASGNARFLSKFVVSGCAGSVGVQYDAWEWRPRQGTSLDNVVSQGGAFGLDDKVPGFEPIGSLQTSGPHITLPYCWFSEIDTWDNPSLCAVDTYDLSGRDVRFLSREVNRPDLLPIAKAIEYAHKREYEAVRGYSGSDAVARKLVREVPPIMAPGVEVKVTHTGRHKERVELGDDTVSRFDVVERSGRWVVVDYRTEENACAP